MVGGSTQEDRLQQAMPIGKKTALDEVIAARNAKQALKSVKQLYIEASGSLAPKVPPPVLSLVPPSRAHRRCARRRAPGQNVLLLGLAPSLRLLAASGLRLGGRSRSVAQVSSFDTVHSRERLDLSHIPGRSRAAENARSVQKREQAAEEAAARMDRARIDWTETDEFGHIVLSSNARCLELSTVPDYAGEGKSGPVYPRGQLIEGINLNVDNVQNCNGTTFELLKPRRKADYNPDESVRYKLADGAHRVRPFELVEPLEDTVLVNNMSGRIEKPHLHLNSVVLPDEDVFKIGRALLHSGDVELLDLYGNFIAESPSVFLIDGLNEAIEEGSAKKLKSISLSGTMPGPALYTSLGETVRLSKASPSSAAVADTRLNLIHPADLDRFHHL